MSESRKLSVFLCHASQDKPIVRELYERLSGEGWIDPWLDEKKLMPGQTWTSTIEDAIDSADNVIIFLSENSVNKEGFVQRELRRAWKRSTEKPENVIFLIPFRLDDCKVPRRLRSKQWVDYFGKKKENTYGSLLASLEQRYEQKLQLEAKEQERANELQDESEEKIRLAKMETYFNEAIAKQLEEKHRRETIESQFKQERARWEQEKKDLLKGANARNGAEVKPKASSKERETDNKTNAYVSSISFSPSAGSSILVDGSIVHFESLGRGRPVIFLHGWVGSWRYWLSSMQKASRTFRAYALDFCGFGDTTHNELRYSLDEQVKLLDGFLNEMGIGKIAIIGHGLGALVGMKFVTRYPQSVDRIMMVNCPLSYDAINPRLRTNSPQESVDWLSNRSPESITALSDAPKTDIKAIAASMVGLQTENLFRNFCNYNIPCLLTYGERDQAIATPSYELSMQGALIHQVNFERSGHFPMIDEPVLFEQLLMAFLYLDSGVSPRELILRL